MAFLIPFIRIVAPIVLGLLFYFTYDFSLRSLFTFSVYTLFAITVFVFTIFFVSFSKFKFTAIFVYLASYLSVYLIGLLLNLNTNTFDLIKGIDYSVISFSTVIFTGAFLSIIKNKVVYKIFNAFYVLLIIISLILPLLFDAYFIANNSLLSSDIIIALAQTNQDEGFEFFISNVNYKWALALAFLFIVIAANIYCLKKLSPTFKTDYKNALSLYVCLILSVFLAQPRMDYLPFSVVKITSKQLNNFDKYKELKEQRALKLASLKGLSLDNSVKDDNGLYILVIGESENASRMSAFGFERKTTPLLEKRASDNEAIIYKNVYSSWPQTVQALSYALTQANQYQNIDVVDAFSLIEVAKVCGFDTYWMSNQRKFGMYETPITVIASTADHEIWINGSSKMEGVYFDYELVNRFEKLNFDKKTLVVIHLMGSHQKYDRRVPMSFATFKSNDSVLDAYDDTLLYTDYVVDSIYEKAKANDNFRAMLYVSDHGEDPYLVGGHDPENVTLNMLHVPMVAYLSDIYKKIQKDKADALKDKKDSYFSNDLVFNLMLELMGITGVPEYSKNIDFTKQEYDINADSLKVMYGKNTLKDLKK